ncbi:DUF3156 family protein [Hoyosella sp. YIM 151337]|uniref:DUF3156 family protein n=1 Tax=Hoyosella sp. YIM 151337 TaxID=2992742 RepID=UPI0022360637|nr:DUF3156 family protein [Hoyosella sp. YIM 151337]MCW4355755.1 DUF3156 family protein [Hoyosella sp. YIM 151337]
MTMTMSRPTRLDAQAFPFQQAGMTVTERQPQRLRLADATYQVTLQFRVRRMLLGRISQLQAGAIVPTARGPEQPCVLELKVTGSKERRFQWKPSSDEASPLTSPLTGPALAALVQAVDLTSCTVTWSPQHKEWRICVEPYAAAHLRVFFPPINYNMAVTQSEAGLIVNAIGELANLLHTDAA